MTKSIRIENADTSDHKVEVVTQNLNAAGEWVDSPSPARLDYPTAQVSLTIWDSRRLVIREVKP